MMREKSEESRHMELLEKLLEQSTYQTHLLGSTINLLELMACQLENISKQTCQSVNELHWQTKIQKSLHKDISYLLEIYKHEHPEAVLRIQELEELKKKVEECCPPKKKKKRICKYEPCVMEPARPGSNELKEGISLPKHVRGAPYKPVIKQDVPNKQPNDRPIRQIPRGPFKGLISETSDSGIKEMGAGDDAPDPVIFDRYTLNTSVAPASTNAADISGGDSGEVVMLTGNWYAQYSTDGGQTFNTVNPTAIFPDTLTGGFCCDQVIQYIPQFEMFVWLLQYSRVGGNNINAYRLAMATPQDIIDSNCTAWTYWDLASGAFNLGTDWMDYPSLSVGNNSLYMSFDVLDNAADALADNGLLVVRFSLSEIQQRSTINYQYTNPGDSAFAWGSNVSQDTGDEVFWAGHVDNSTIRVFSLQEGSNTYFWRDIDVNNWANNTQVSNGPNGNNWFGHNLAAGWQFPMFAVIGITRRLDELWLSWTASNGDGGFGGFNFPHPHVQLVKIDVNSYTLLEQMQVWNPDLAFGYPSLATNSENEVGIVLGWGGGGSFHANSAVGIIGDYVVWYRDGSTWTHTRWGDYVSARNSSADSRLFAGFGYITVQDATTTVGHRFDPYFVRFGRKSNVKPPIE